MKQSFEAIIEHVVAEPNKIQPIIVNFQHGELKDKEVKKMECNLYRDQEKNKTVLALSNGHIVYKGYKPEPKEQLTRTMIVLHNKKTGKVRLIEAEQWQVSPVLQKPVMIEENKNDADGKIIALNKEFGSKKAKRRSELYEKMKVDVNSVQEQLEQTVADIQIDKLDLSAPLPDEITNLNLPICNRNATNIKDVYNIYELIPKSKLDTLYDYAMETLDEDLERKSKFFIRIFKAIQSDPDKVNKVAVLLYIEMITLWLSMPMKEIKKRDVVVCRVSEEVNAHIINMYSISSANGRLRPNIKKDQAVIHALILALTISNFALDLELFQVMLPIRISLKRLTYFAKIIGAVPDKSDKKIIELKLPLPAPARLIQKRKKTSVSTRNSV